MSSWRLQAPITTQSDPMTVYFKSLPIPDSPCVERRVAWSTLPSNVNVSGARGPAARTGLRGVLAALTLCALCATFFACTPRDPPAPDATPWLAAPESAVPDASPPPATAESDARAASPPATAATERQPDPGTLPQTRDVPSADTAAFAARTTVLWNAIVNDDPDAAMPFFFPLSAYRQVKDVADPANDWKHRLVAAYARDIHALHARLARRTANGARPTLVGLEVPRARSRWVDPGEEWNKLGYYRVFDSKLRFDIDGARDAFDVKSLISWRGEWYVVHLSAVR
ncbi:MAG: hypothetical protein FWD17_09420 [Polyangiaceae bacterium]|nr:hypothetical protein [Polyangiaceae bacterium]